MRPRSVEELRQQRLARLRPGGIAARLKRNEVAGAPRIWVLMGHQAGDNAQLLALAEALGWSYEVKRFAHRRSELVTNLLFDATLLGRSRSRSDPLAPPWPDLVISAGRRSEPIARWIRGRADPPPMLVHVGRPWRDPREFDLVIVTPQYPLGPRPGVLCNPLPLHGVTGERLTRAAAEWQPRLARLPRPWIAVLVGGHSELFTLGPRAATRLVREAGAMARASGGSLLVTTSARTSSRAAAALRDAIDVPAHVFRWTADAPDNPYWGYLALADSFIVTGDSVSMLTEACATGKPVFVFDPGRTRSGPLGDPTAAVRRRVMNLGLRRLRRDIRRVHDELIRRGHAALLGGSFAADAPPPLRQVERAVGAVRALLGEGAPPGTAGAPCDPRRVGTLGS
jgi:mitochondrial fission protein ELM1